MAKIKIHELAKELKMGNKELIEIANKLGLGVTSHLNAIEEKEANKIRENVKGEDRKAEVKTTGQVIIRREVIVADEEEEKEKKKIEEAKKKAADLGFNQKRNKDYNIVYREKPSKPMTVSELFGIKPKKEEKKVEKKSKEEITTHEATKQEDGTKITRKVIIKDETRVDQEKEQFSKVKDNVVSKPIHETKPTFNKNLSKNNSYDSKSRNNDSKTRGYVNHSTGYNNRGNSISNVSRSNGYNNHQNNNERGFNRNNRNNNNNNFKRPMNNKNIDRNIKDIMSTEIPEKSNQRDYSTRIIDKQKANRYNNQDDKKRRNRRGDEEDNFNEDKLRNLKQVDRLSNMFEDQEGGMLDYYDLTTVRGKRNKRKPKKDEERNKQKIFDLKEITIPENITVKDLAVDLKKTSSEVIKKLFDLGIMATINQTIDFDTAYLVADSFGVTANKKEEVKDEDILFDDSEDKEEDLQPRPPVVVVMGHVDHGKTSLLDAIRKTNVIEGEAGGITQHIGAYKVNINGREITFLDTPGHEAFTSMRARGAQITDIAILVVAADDGVMPQTVEAINHAKSANIPIIVAINKIDLPGANPDRVKQELMKYDLVPEEWGGDTIYVPISALKHINIDNLLEMVLLEADMLNLRANPNKQAKGAVIEARLDKAQGPVASMLVQRGTLNVGDRIIVGNAIGRIRTMKNDKGKKVKEAGPSTPVEVTGLTEVPEAGDIFYEVKDEKTAKHLIEQRKLASREKSIANNDVVTLDNLFEKMESEDLKQLNIIVKTDVQGTAEAMKSSLEKLSNDEVKVKVIHSNAGGVTESDVQLAKAAKAIIIAFNVRPVGAAKQLAEKDGVEIKQYSVIYQALEDVEDAMKGMLAPVYVEKNIGNAEVRQTFRISNVGTIAGCFVLDGKLERNAGVRVIREGVVIHDGKLVSLKRYKDDAKEVSKGFECGIQIQDYNDVKEGDIIEAYIQEEVKR